MEKYKIFKYKLHKFIRHPKLILPYTIFYIKSYIKPCFNKLNPHKLHKFTRHPKLILPYTICYIKLSLIRLKSYIIRLKSYVISGISPDILAVIFEMLKQGDPQKVADYLSNKYKFYTPPSIHTLIRLYKYASEIENKDFNLWSPNNNKEKLLIHFCCWGSSYTDKAKKYLLPSLLANNNLPILSKKFNISLLIHCDETTKISLIKSTAYKKLKKYASITFCIFPQKLINFYYSSEKREKILHFRYLFLGVCQTHALRASLKHQAYLSYLMPDVVLSESFYKTAFSEINGKSLVLTTTTRSNYITVQPELDKLYSNTTQDQLSIPENKLLKLQIEHIHPQERRFIVSTETKNFFPSVRLIFKNKNGFIIRSFHYHPVLINCTNINKSSVIPDYLPIDNTILNNILNPNIPYKEQAWVCTDALQMAIMELSDKNAEIDLMQNINTLSYNELVSQMRSFVVRQPTTVNTPFNQFLASFRLQYIVPGYENTWSLEDELIDDERFFNDLQ